LDLTEIADGDLKRKESAVGEDREKVSAEDAEDVEAHKLARERQDVAKVPPHEPDEDVEGHALLGADQKVSEHKITEH
jgi:hypothetical protein